ncbi:MAG: nitrilase-related carbon-nitrogen hydrolase [Salinarchaeum sp.]
MKLALAQLAVDGGDLVTNRERAIEAIERAGAMDADLVALPELFSVGYFAFDAYERSAEAIDGPTLTALADAAAAADTAVLAGTVIEDLAATTDVPTPADTGLANTAVLFDASGERRLVYRKHHLFGYDSTEAEQLVSGDRLAVATIGGFTIGVTTCYDLRFPELYRSLVEAGATLTLVPSAWPYPRVEHWNLLPRTRALENLMYVAAINGAGAVNGETLVGRSMVVDPWGTPIAKTGAEPDMVTARLDPERVMTVRDEFPALADRRSE